MKIPEEIGNLSGRLAQYARMAASRVLGTRLESNGGFRAIRLLDHGRHIHRAEITAIVSLLIDKGVFTLEEYQGAMKAEMEMLLSDLQQEWPEIVAHPQMTEVKDAKAFAERAKREGWPP